MLKAKQHARGGFLVLAALTIVVLIGVAGLALDIGRVLVLRTEMQNAVDAAALAAAAELDNRDDAQARAMDAARNTIIHSSHFARVSSLLGDDGLPDEAFTFFCVIGSPQDVDSNESGFVDFCSGSEAPGEPEKFLAASDSDSHYVRITLSEAISGNSNQFTADLLFLPILQLIDDSDGPLEPLEAISLSAVALAGRSFYSCKYPPMALCDPFEGGGSHFRDSMPIGGHIELKQQGANQWASGNFGFLQALNAANDSICETGPGADKIACYLADEKNVGCTPSIVTTEPGGMTQKVKSALNTRLDIYEPPSPFNQSDAPSNFPPAESVSQYTLDQTTSLTDPRFGMGDWDFDAYKQLLIDAGISTGSMPATWNNANPPKRWDVYQWETSSTGTVYTVPTHTPADYERRFLRVAVLSCNALGLTGGKSTAPVFGHDGFAKMFLFKQAEGPPNAKIWAEYIGWGDEDDADYHVDIQLYE